MNCGRWKAWDNLEALSTSSIDRPHAQADCSNNSDAVATITLPFNFEQVFAFYLTSFNFNSIYYLSLSSQALSNPTTSTTLILRRHPPGSCDQRPNPTSTYTSHTTMGASLSRLWSLVWSKKEIRILILGLVCVHAIRRGGLPLDAPKAT